MTSLYWPPVEIRSCPACKDCPADRLLPPAAANADGDALSELPKAIAPALRKTAVTFSRQWIQRAQVSMFLLGCISFPSTVFPPLVVKPLKRGAARIRTLHCGVSKLQVDSA